MLLPAVLMFYCLLLRSGSSAPLPAVFPVVGVASPKATAPEAPPTVIVKVEDTKTNTTLSFGIFILAEEEEGSGAGGGGRSDKNSSGIQDNDIINDISSEETNKQESDTSSQPMNEEHNLSSEEMMSDQPMFSEEETNDFNNTMSDGNKWNQKLTLSDDFDDDAESDVIQKLTDDFNNSIDSREVYSQPTVSDYFDDKNTRIDDFNNKTGYLTSPLSDDFNNSTEMNDQRTIFDSFQDGSSSSDDPALALSDDFNNPSSSEVTELHRNLQGISLNPENQQMFGSNTVDEFVPDAAWQKVTGPNSEKTSSVNQNQVGFSRGRISKDFMLGSGLQEVFRSIQEVLDLLPGHQGVMEVKGSRHKVLGSSFSLLTGFSLSSDESSETFGKTFGGAPTIWNMLKDTMSQQSARSSSQVGVTLSSSSSEESQEAAVGLKTSRVWSPEVSSSSEEVVSPALVSLLVPSPQTPAESESSSSESQESDSSGSRSTSDSPGLDSGTDSELHPDPIPSSEPDLSPGSNFDPSVGIGSEVCQEESEQAPTIKVATDANSDVSRGANPTVDYRANTASMHVSSGASIDGKLDSSVKDTEADFNFEATTHSGNDVSIDVVYSTSLPSMHVSSGASIDGKLDSSVKDIEADLNFEATTHSGNDVSIDVVYSTSLPSMHVSSGASIDGKLDSSVKDTEADLNFEATTHSGNNVSINVVYSTSLPSMHVSSRASIDGKLDSSIRDTEADLNFEATTHSGNDVSIDAVHSTSPPSKHVSSGAGIDVNTDAVSKLSVEDDVSTDGTAESTISMQPTATTEYRTNPPDFKASTDAIANVEKEHSGTDVSVESLPPPLRPPRRKKPYHFGFLGPLSHSYVNQPVTMGTLAMRHHQNQNVQDFFNSQYDADRRRHQ